MKFGDAYKDWLKGREGTKTLLQQFRVEWTTDEKLLRGLPPYSKVTIFKSSELSLNGLEVIKVSDGKGRMLVSTKKGLWRIAYSNLKSDAIELMKKL